MVSDEPYGSACISAPTRVLFAEAVQMGIQSIELIRRERVHSAIRGVLGSEMSAHQQAVPRVRSERG